MNFEDHFNNFININDKFKPLAEIVKPAFTWWFECGKDEAESQLKEARAEVERLKTDNSAMYEILSNVYDEELLNERETQMYENFLTYGQGGANFIESQQMENAQLRELPKQILSEIYQRVLDVDNFEAFAPKIRREVKQILKEIFTKYGVTGDKQ